MRSLTKKLALLALGVASCAVSAQNVTVNPGAGSFATLKDAFDAVNAGTHTGALTVSVIADTTETASAVLNASGTGAANYTSMTISPVGARTIAGVITGALVDFSGADNVTIDGINAGGNTLTINNNIALSTSGISTIRYINGATGNTITNATILGAGSMAVGTNGGNIYFATDGVTTNGNDNNTVSNNNIGPSTPTTFPSKGIYCNGTTTTTAIGNSGLTITNNNIFDFFAAATTSAGVHFGGGCNTASITNNRFYQTGTRTWTTGANHRPIDINGSTTTSGAQGMTITGNIIGYASNTQTGTYTLTGSTGKFCAIQLAAISTSGGGAANIVNNNIIANVSLAGVTSSGTGTSSPLMGILISNGPATTNNNTIGSQSATGSLVLNATTTTATDVYGIYNFSVDNWPASDNNIGGISAQTTATTTAMTIYGMRANTSTTANATLTNNLVGGTIANSIINNTASTAAQNFGIVTSNAIANWRGNTVRNLTSVNGTGTSTTASVIGMLLTSGTPIGHLLERNTVEKLANTNAAAATTVAGLQYTSGTGTVAAPNIIARNAIRQLSVASATGIVNGINISGGASTYRNNMIRLGQDATGADITVGASINGINTLVGTDNFFNNTILIQGTGVGGTANTFAMNHQTTVNTRFFQNNIFYNARSGGGKHYAVRFGGSTPNPTGLTSNFNLFFADGTNGVLGLYNAVDQATIAAWQTATGQDANSIAINPALVSATDLHLTIGSPARNVGLVLASVTDDFDGKLRPGSNALYDIGADEFDGIVPAANDFRATAFVSPASGGQRGAGVPFAPIASFTNLGTNTQNNVTVRYRILNGATEVYNQTGTVVTAITGVTTPITFPNATLPAGNYNLAARSELVGDNVPANDEILGTLTVLPALAGTYTVGSGGNFASLTNAGGIFEALNSLSASANITINIISDLTGETGAVALNELPTGIAVAIRPSGAPRLISGSTAGSLIILNGADNVTIDGSLTGGTAGDIAGGNPALRQLTITNTLASTAGALVLISSGAAGAQNNTVKNLSLIGFDPTQTLVGISVGGATAGVAGADNDNLRIENISIRKAIIGIYNAGISAANQNTGTVITKNDFTGIGIDRIRRVGMLLFSHDAPVVSFNDIAGIETNESVDAIGIALGLQDVSNAQTTSGGITGALVTRNRINGVASLSATGFSAAGIAVAGGTTAANVISNNMIAGVTAPATSPDFATGIFVAGVTGANTKLYYNSINLTGNRGNVATQNPSFGISITGVDPTVEMKNNAVVNNLIVDPAAAGAANAKSYAVGMISTLFVNLDANYNDYFTSGAQSGGFRTGSLSPAAGVDYTTLAAWQTAISDDANALLADPLFVSATDLHLQAASPAINVGTPIAGITVDFDGDTRAAPPEIGADEIPPPNTAPTITPAVGVTRQQGSAATNSTIATVSDAEQPIGGLTVTAPTVPTGLSVSSIANASGTVSANLAAACTATLGANTVVLNVSDGLLNTNGNLSVNVTANSAPTLGSYITINATTGVSTSATPGAAPTDNGSIALMTAAAPSFTGTFAVNTSTGVVSITNPGPAGTYTVTVTATDNCDLTSQQTFTLVVTNANTAPTITPAVGLSRQQGSATTNSTIATVADAEQAAGSLTVTASTVPPNLAVTGIANAAGTVSANLAAACTATLGANTVVLNVSDGLLNTNGNLSVNVTVNTAPTLATYPTTNATTGTNTTATPAATPTDNGTIATITAAAAPAGFTGTLVVNTSTGVVSINNPGPSGTYTIIVTATDNCGLTSQQTFALNVSNANTAPTITPAAGLTRQQGTAVSNSNIATVADDGGAAAVVVTVNGGATATNNGVTLSNIVNTAGAVTADLVASCTATNASFTLRATDGASLFNEATLNVAVTNNTAPVLSYPASTNAVFGQSLIVNPLSGPSDNGSITNIAVQSLGTYTGTATVNTGPVSLGNAQAVGSHTIVIRATDNCGTTTDANLALTVGQASTTTTITADTPDPSLVAGPVLVTYTVVAVAPGGGTPTGNVTVSDGVDSCTATVAAGQCTLTLNTLGARTLTATYTGSAAHAGSNGNATHTVVGDNVFRNGFEDPILLLPTPTLGNASSLALPVSAIQSLPSGGDQVTTVLRIQVGNDTFAVQMRGDGANREVRIVQENGSFETPWIRLALLTGFNFVASVDANGQLSFALQP